MIYLAIEYGESQIARARLLAAAVPLDDDVVYPHARVQEHNLDDYRAICARMLRGGDAMQPSPPSLVLAVGSHADVLEQIAAAEAEGVPVHQVEEGDLLGCELGGDAEAVEVERVDFRSVGDVLRASFCGADRVCGTQALDYGRVGAGAYHSAREAQIVAGLRIAVADAIMAEARRYDWEAWYDDALRMMTRGRAEAEIVAASGGLSQSEVVRGLRIALGRVRDALAERGER